jgi:hypothetical protein
MSTKADNPLDEMRERIGELEAKAQAAGERKADAAMKKIR